MSAKNLLEHFIYLTLNMPTLNIKTDKAKKFDPENSSYHWVILKRHLQKHRWEIAYKKAKAEYDS